MYAQVETKWNISFFLKIFFTFKLFDQIHRASNATHIYDQHVDEQLICEITGHPSKAVRNYKRTSETLNRKVNSVVQGMSTNDDDAKSPQRKLHI